jgi:membrane dipeptidase
MKHSFPVITAILMVIVTAGFQDTTGYRQMHERAILVDTHNDVVQRMLGGEDLSRRTHHGHSDLPRWQEGGVDLEFFSIWVPPEMNKPSYTAQADRQIDTVLQFIKRNPEKIGQAKTAAEARELIARHKLAAMFGMEGGHPINGDLRLLDHFYDRGVRYMTLTWNNSTSWATSAADETDREHPPKHKGLTALGKKIVRRMNRLGMIVDVSHVGEQTFWDVLATSNAPVFASHSSAWALCHHRRNLTDRQLKALAAKGGVVCVNFAPWFIDSTFGGKEERMRERNKTAIDRFRGTLTGDEFIKDMLVAEYLKPQYDSIRPPLSLLIDHIDYMVRLIGADHVGIGSDFDGISVTPMEMDDVSSFPLVTRELLKRGYREEDIRKILGENVLRLMTEVESRRSK